MFLAKEQAKGLQRDFIPNGGRIDIRTLRFRHTKPDEVYQCCRQVSHDPQSGPIYCGDVAEYNAPVNGGWLRYANGIRRRATSSTADSVVLTSSKASP